MYDFKTTVNRLSQGSSKWKLMLEENPNVSKDIIPFSVADTDLVHPPELIEPLKDFLDKAVLGYTLGTSEYYQSVKKWMKNRHNWDIDTEWIVQSPGVIAALYNTIQAFTNKNEGVIIMSPVYYPFKTSILNSNRNLVDVPLICKNESYKINYDLLEEKAKDINNKLLILCSPHNPVGRVWTKEELVKVSDICLKHNVLILSDEIHFDLIMPGHEHTVLATISKNIEQNSIICTAPSKSFNLAGMQTSNIIIPNSELRQKYVNFTEKNGFHSINILGQKTCEIAYNNCEDWLDEFVHLINHNHIELKKYLNEHLPQIKVFDLEGTYLQWMDFNSLGLSPSDLEVFLKQEAELFFDEGYIFGEEGEGFERMNIACPTDVMLKALERLVSALKKKGLI